MFARFGRRVWRHPEVEHQLSGNDQIILATPPLLGGACSLRVFDLASTTFTPSFLHDFSVSPPNFQHCPSICFFFKFGPCAIDSICFI